MVADRFVRAVMMQVAKRGFVVRRNPAVRRQAMLRSNGVDVVFDVGAAKGAYGQELREFGYQDTIVSFEPLAEAYGRLVRAKGDDPLWQTVNCALGSRAEQATIHVAANSDSSSLLPLAQRHLTAAPQVGYVGTETVEVERLDTVAPDHLRPGSRAFLKIDTQGFEREVLDGGQETLRQCVGLQLELSFVPLYEGGMLVDEAVSMAYAAGFHLVGLEPGFADPDGQVLQADGVFFRDV